MKLSKQYSYGTFHDKKIMFATWIVKPTLLLNNMPAYNPQALRYLGAVHLKRIVWYHVLYYQKSYIILSIDSCENDSKILSKNDCMILW